MKGAKLISITVIVAVCILVLGILISIIGWAVSSAYFKNREYKDLESLDKTIAESIVELDISLGICELKIIEGKEFKIDASNFRTGYLDYEIKDGKLTINEKEDIRGWRNFWYLRTRNNYHPQLTIYIPDDTVFEIVNIELGIGVADINNISADRITLICGAGELRGKSLTAEKCIVESGVGTAKLNDVNFKGLALSGGVGYTSLNGKITGLIDVERGVGEIDLIINGSKSDYYINASGGIGEIKVNGSRYNKDDYSKSAENTINASNGIGKISITFE